MTMDVYNNLQSMRRPSGEEDVTSCYVYWCQYWCYTYQRVNLFGSSYTMAVNLIVLPQQLGLLLFPEIPSPHVQRVSGTCSFHWTGSVNGAKRNFSYIWFTLLWHRIMTSVSLQRCKSQMKCDVTVQNKVSVKNTVAVDVNCDSKKSDFFCH